MKIELSECPQILQDEVNKYLSHGKNKKVICISKHDFTGPYKSNTREFSVTVQSMNAFKCFSCYDPDIAGVYEDTMTADAIIDIIQNSEGNYFRERGVKDGDKNKSKTSKCK